MADDLTGRVGLDTTQFKTGVTQLTAQIKAIENGFRASAAVMDNWSGTSDGLRQRTESLSQKLELQKQQLTTLTSEYKKAVSEQGADSKAAQSLAGQMFGVEQSIQKTNANLEKYSTQLKNTEKQEKENDSSLERLKTGFLNLANQSKSSTSNISSHFSSLKSSIAGAVAGIGISLGVTGLVKSIYGIAESASDLVEAQNVVENTFKASSKAVENWTGTMAQSAGISKTAATQFVGTMGAMLKSSGVTESSASMMSEKLVQLTGDMSSFYNVSTTDMWEKIRSGISGETEPLKQLGINMSVANLSAYAMSQGIKTSYDKMTQAQQATLRYNYLLSVTKDAQGDFARTSNNSMANQSRIFQMNIESMKETVGATFLPMINSMFNAVNPWIQSEIPKLASSAQNLADGIKQHSKDIAEFVKTSAVVIKDIFGFVESHGGLVKGVIIGIVTAIGLYKAAVLAANIVQGVSNALTVASAIATGGLAAGKSALAAATGGTTLATIALSGATVGSTAAYIAHTIATGAATAATGALTAAQGLLNAAFLASPIGWIVLGIGGVVTAIILLWNNCKGFRDFWIGAWNDIKSGWNSAIAGIKSAWSSLNPLQWGKDLADGIANGINSAAQHVRDSVNKVATDIRKFLHFSVPDEGPLVDYESWMPDFMAGLAKGIDANKYKVTAAMRSLAAGMSISPTASSAYAGRYSTPQMIDNSVTKAPVININGPVNVQSKGGQDATLQQLQFLAAV